MKKYLFIDRDGTLIKEPQDFQIDSIEKFELLPDVISSLQKLSQAGFEFVMVTNQDGLGTQSYAQKDYDLIQTLLMSILSSQGIKFKEVLMCPHFEDDKCTCRKPKTELVHSYISSNEMDRKNSFVIGDRQTDLDLAKNMGLEGIKLNEETSWKNITRDLLDKPRKAKIIRYTNETQIEAQVCLEPIGETHIQTELGFFDHMLEQLSKHGKFDLSLKAKGDLHIDTHHLIEDVAITLGQALKEAIGDKRGIERYGFWLPMDEASCLATIDLSGRADFVFEGKIPQAEVGQIPSEMFIHFFKSLSENLSMSLHIVSRGENSHHIVESMFKAVGRALAQAFNKTKDNSIPSTKGVL